MDQPYGPKYGAFKCIKLERSLVNYMIYVHALALTVNSQSPLP